jgi:hypothetical protein
MRAIALLTVLAAIPACFRVNYVDRTKQPTGPSYSESFNWFGYGFGGSAKGRLTTLNKCGDAGVAKISSSTGVFGTIVSIVTLGIWRRRVWTVTCGGGAQ